MNEKRLIVKPALMAAFVALIAAGAFLAVPIPGSPVPVILQNMFVMIAGLLLGPAWGSAAIVLYLFLGVLGLPVFSGGMGGMARIAGPTGGFLLGFLPAIAAIGLIAGKGKPRIWRYALAVVAGIVITYAAGLSWLHRAINEKESWVKTFAIGFIPYIGWDVLKAAVAVVVSVNLRPWLDERLSDRDE